VQIIEKQMNLLQKKIFIIELVYAGEKLKRVGIGLSCCYTAISGMRIKYGHYKTRRWNWFVFLPQLVKKLIGLSSRFVIVI